MKPVTWFSKWTGYVIISIFWSLLETVQLFMSGCTGFLIFSRLLASVWVPWSLRMAPCWSVLWWFSDITYLLPSPRSALQISSGSTGWPGLKPCLLRGQLWPKLSWAACLTPYSLKTIWFQATWLAFVYQVNEVCVWECHSFSWQYQKELFLLFRGCRFGRILRNLNQVSLGPFQRRLESPRGLEALRRGSASKTSS